jgi:hypothetical protein
VLVPGGELGSVVRLALKLRGRLDAAAWVEEIEMVTQHDASCGAYAPTGNAGGETIVPLAGKDRYDAADDPD